MLYTRLVMWSVFSELPNDALQLTGVTARPRAIVLRNGQIVIFSISIQCKIPNPASSVMMRGMMTSDELAYTMTEC